MQQEDAPTLQVRHLGAVAYEPTFEQMKAYTNKRSADSADEIWLLEHPPVFTQGQAGKAEHLLMPGDIPVVQVDRGGQVTYHGPGQLVAYVLLDIRRLGLGVRDLVNHLEHSVVDVLAQYGVSAYPKSDAPGVYVETEQGEEAKIASLGLRIRRGFSYHGLALNVDMDLAPFQRINPCGYQGLAVTHLKSFTDAEISVESVGEAWLSSFTQRLGHGDIRHF